VVVGTCWHPDDVYHHLSGKPGFYTLRYSFEKEDESDGYRLFSWPEKFPPERLKRIRAELGELEYARQKRCRVVATEATKLFSNFERYLMRRAEYPPIEEMDTFFGVDLSTKSRPGNVIAVIGVHRKTKRRYLLAIRYGAWTSPQTAKMIGLLYDEFRPQVVMVENNAYQGALLEWMRESGYFDIPLKAFTTGRNKADPQIGIPSLAVEIENGSWAFTKTNHALGCTCGQCRLYSELRSYPLGKYDGIMALWMAREAARLSSLSSGVRIILV